MNPPLLLVILCVGMAFVRETRSVIVGVHRYVLKQISAVWTYVGRLSIAFKLSISVQLSSLLKLHLHSPQTLNALSFLCCMYMNDSLFIPNHNRSALIPVATLIPVNLLMKGSVLLDHAERLLVSTRPMVAHAGHPVASVTLQSIAPGIRLSVQRTRSSRMALHATATLATATKDTAQPMNSSARKALDKVIRISYTISIANF